MINKKDDKMTQFNKIVEPTVFPFEMNFLDTTIHNSGNSDGFVPVVKNAIDFRSHLGNYSTLRDAMKGAFLYFLISRPKHFHSSTFHRLIGTKTYHEWWTFNKVCKDEMIAIPESIYLSEDTNCTIETDFEDALRRH